MEDKIISGINQQFLKEHNLNLEYEIKEIPDWYIQGSFVLDKIFNKDYARDIDIFIKEGVKLPEIETEKFIHKIKLPKNKYFPPFLGCYNTDYYLLTKEGIIKPIGFPEKPKSLEILGKNNLTIIDVIRGIKISTRYGLNVPNKVKKIWKKTLKKHFDPEWMQMMDFQTEEEFNDYLMEVIKEQTNDDERINVLEYLNQFLDIKLNRN